MLPAGARHVNIAANLRAAFARHGIMPKQFAMAAGVHYSTVHRWLSGDTRLIDVTALLRGCDALNIREEVIGTPRHWWFDDKGHRHECDDLAAFVRDHLRLTHSISGDLAAVARRNLGWVSVSAHATATVAYHERGVSVKAMGSAREAIQRYPAVTRVVSLDDGRDVRVGPELPQDAAQALVLAIAAARLPVPSKWHVSRLPVAQAPDGRLPAIWLGKHADPLDVVGRSALLPYCSIIHRRDDGALQGVRIGAKNPLTMRNKELLTGHALQLIPDIRYVEMLAGQIETTLSEGLTVTRRRGSVLGQRAEYICIAMKAASNIYVSQTIAVG